MLVRSYGFSLEAGNSVVSVAEVFALMASQIGAPDNSKSNERRFYVDDTSDPEFVRGLVVTVKDQKEFCELVSDANGGFVISVKSLVGENKLMEFNFFVVNKKNGLGIYQHYHQSCTPNTFGSYLRARYTSLSEKAKEDRLAELEANGTFTRAKEKAIKAAHKGRLGFGLLVHNESLAAVLAKFQNIKAFEYEYASLAPNKMVGVPIGPHVKRLKERVTFKPKIGIDILSQAIQDTVNQLKPKSGRVSVIDHIDDEDVPMSVKIANIPEHFGEQDYSAIAQKLDQLDVKVFSTHAVVEELINACKDTYKHIFMTKLKK